MKPGEFDELIRQKFEQNDFAYDPANWERLKERMDGPAKKRSMLMWLWMPAAGMAASVALAMGVTSLLRFGVPDGSSAGGGYAATGKFNAPREREDKVVAMVPSVNYQATERPAPSRSRTPHARNTARPATQPSTTAGNGIGLKLDQMTKTSVAANQQHSGNRYDAEVYNSATPPVAAKAQPPKPEKKAVAAVQEPMHTFRKEEAQPPVRKKMNFSVILSGGVNQGNNNSGYMAGATVRKMINDKVYIESDIAFASSDNVQRTKVESIETVGGGATSGGGMGSIQAKVSSASKVSSDGVATQPVNNQVRVIKTQDVSYNLSYAQITPSVGVKLAKRMSIGMGPDFQAMLQDHRPERSIVDRENIAVAPTFDVGFVGKTEYAFTNRIKAGVAYRKGVNGVIVPGGKYIDRDYLQFQMKCTIFNK
ncbi:hypothetical protein GCM10023093_30790 [Nemorincola caseinilytica]|uniref:Outer membrane protein beta-barrel domain-containing protein n=1 Tax=Nemorincola caseinilytica TaxID=2054315 RepID=A0ABP8NNR5_9BACT